MKFFNSLIYVSLWLIVFTIILVAFVEVHELNYSDVYRNNLFRALLFMVVLLFIGPLLELFSNEE